MTTIAPAGLQRDGLCRILSLDGGGAKGFYTLGVLREIEAAAKRPLCEVFDVIFGTSTGSIIASLLAIGRSVEDIHTLYSKHVPGVMQAKQPPQKSHRLSRVGVLAFGDRKFDAVKTNLGVVATKWQIETPMIFKSFAGQAHGRTATFVPGFGCFIRDAVQASCSAFPFFEKMTVTTSTKDKVELIDGGYCANNPTLYALADAVGALGFQAKNCRVISIGCGNYPPRKTSWEAEIATRVKLAIARQFFFDVQLLQKTMEINTASMEQLRQILFPTVPAIRISDRFEKPEMATDMFEHDMGKLNLLRQRGSESFASREADIRAMLMGA